MKQEPESRGSGISRLQAGEEVKASTSLAGIRASRTRAIFAEVRNAGLDDDGRRRAGGHDQND